MCIYDSLHRRSHWIRVGGTADGIQVLSYDARRAVVRVRVNGAAEELTQRKAAVVAGLALPPIQPIAAAAPAADNSSPANPGSGPESGGGRKIAGNCEAGARRPDAGQRPARDRHPAAQGLRGSAEKGRQRQLNPAQGAFPARTR